MELWISYLPEQLQKLHLSQTIISCWHTGGTFIKNQETTGSFYLFIKKNTSQQQMLYQTHQTVFYTLLGLLSFSYRLPNVTQAFCHTAPDSNKVSFLLHTAVEVVLLCCGSFFCTSNRPCKRLYSREMLL